MISSSKIEILNKDRTYIYFRYEDKIKIYYKGKINGSKIVNKKMISKKDYYTLFPKYCN